MNCNIIKYKQGGYCEAVASYSNTQEASVTLSTDSTLTIFNGSTVRIN